MNGKLSRKFKEYKGVKQGRNKSSDHYKVYIAPLLDTLEKAELGFWIGNICVSVSAVADDIYPMSNNQAKLQALLDIAEQYGKMYRIEYGASKTKVTVVGSDIDMAYYEEVSPWKMNDLTVNVTENNEHLGQIVSGSRQEEKNVDKRLEKGRNNLFGLLGAGFSYKCFLSPVVKLHIFRTYTCPILRSGLSSFSLRTAQLEPLALFQRKTLKSILKLSKTAPTPAIHFLTGEMPLEGKIHRDCFSLFYGIWCNPDLKLNTIVKYLTKNSAENSRTWSVHLRHLCRRYQMEDPFVSLCKDPPSRTVYKEMVATRITVYYEQKLRQAAATNSQMEYLNVSTTGLRGRHHPALSNMITTREVKLSRPHLKFLSGNYLTYQTKSDQSGGSPHCRICKSDSETVSHVVSVCDGMAVERGEMLEQLEQLCTMTKTKIEFKDIISNEKDLTQFILDPASLNLSTRVSLSDPLISTFYKFAREFCFLIDKTRIDLLNKLKDDKL